MRRAPARLNALSVSKLIRYLQDVPSTVAELMAVSGLCEKTTRRFVLALEREKAVRVVGWEQDKLGRYVTKVYAFGDGKSVKKPPAERARNAARQERRAQRLQIEMQNAIAGVA